MKIIAIFFPNFSIQSSLSTFCSHSTTYRRESSVTQTNKRKSNEKHLQNIFILISSYFACRRQHLSNNIAFFGAVCFHLFNYHLLPPPHPIHNRRVSSASIFIMKFTLLPFFFSFYGCTCHLISTRNDFCLHRRQFLGEMRECG